MMSIRTRSYDLRPILLTDTGMNDVLPKPFTKEGLLLMLQDQLKHLVRIGNIMPPGAMPSHFAFSASQHAHPDSHQSLNDGPAPNNGNNNIKYSVSPAPSKSPVTAGGLYGSGRSPAELGDDVAAQVHPTSGMDDPGGYVVHACIGQQRRVLKLRRIYNTYHC